MDASSLKQYTLDTAPSEGYNALIVGVWGFEGCEDKKFQEESLRELFFLADTAGIKNILEMFLHLKRPDPAEFFHSGHLSAIQAVVSAQNLNLIIIDIALKPNQLRNLEENLKIRVLGRIELILDIFAMRARTKASALQVELAQLTYILPRLKGLGGVLSRLGGGIGTRGPGESMLETDRRHIRRRIQKIEEDLEQESRHRANMRKNRSIATFALVGYTNAGKSSLLNAISKSSKKVFAEDRLFATLDSFSRKVYLGESNFKPLYAIVTDTIGFIRNLPANLIAAFYATLEDIVFTDAVIVVSDASSMMLEDEMMVVKAELDKLGVAEEKLIYFFNKEDLVFPEHRQQIMEKYPQAIWGSSLSKEGPAKLREKLFAVSQKMEHKNHGYFDHNSASTITGGAISDIP